MCPGDSDMGGALGSSSAPRVSSTQQLSIAAGQCLRGAHSSPALFAVPSLPASCCADLESALRLPTNPNASAWPEVVVLLGALRGAACCS